MHGLKGGRWGGGTACEGCWSRVGVLRNATTMTRSGPPPQTQSPAEPAAYLTPATRNRSQQYRIDVLTLGLRGDVPVGCCKGTTGVVALAS